MTRKYIDEYTTLLSKDGVVRKSPSSTSMWKHNTNSGDDDTSLMGLSMTDNISNNDDDDDNDNDEEKNNTKNIIINNNNNNKDQSSGCRDKNNGTKKEPSIAVSTSPIVVIILTVLSTLLVVSLVLSAALYHSRGQYGRTSTDLQHHHQETTMDSPTSTKNTNGNSPTNSKYTKVQYYGFQIYTGGAPAYLEDAAHFDDGDHDDDDNDDNDDDNEDSNSNTLRMNQNSSGNNDPSTMKKKKTPNPECIRSSSFGQVLLGPHHPELRCYLGHKDPFVDVQHRLTIMRQAVERAYNDSLLYHHQSTDDTDHDDDDDDDDNESINNDNTTLKIFVAPEFYWRGIEGAYTFDTLDRIVTNREQDCHGPICSILRGLEDIVQDRRFVDWLFVFGTIIASQPVLIVDETTATATTTKTATTTSTILDGNTTTAAKTNYLYYNFAPIYKGFDPTKMKGTSPSLSSSDKNKNSSNDKDDEVVDMVQHQQQQQPVGKRFLLPKRYIASNDFLTPKADRVMGMDWNWMNEWEEVLGPSSTDNDQLVSTSTHDTTTTTSTTTTTDNPFYGPNHTKRLRYDYDDLFMQYKQQLYEDGGYTIIEYDWLILDGLTLSLEVCFDHQKKTALNTYLGDIIGGRTTRIPSSSDDIQGMGKLEYVAIPFHQAQISLVSSAGMTVVADSLALTNDGIIFLQDGLSNDTSRTYMDDEMKSLCDQGTQFEGGTEAVTRRAIVSNTDVNFIYDVIQSDRRVSLYDNDDDGTTSAWKDALKDTFTAVIYEPHLIVHKPLDIAPVPSGA